MDLRPIFFRLFVRGTLGGSGSVLERREVERRVKKEISAVAMSTATYAVYMCSNPDCLDGEFAERVQPIYVELPRCPCCGSLAQIGEVLSRESWG